MKEFITLPGIGGSGVEHWQTIWENENKHLRRFRPSSWDAPEIGDWCAALDNAVRETRNPPVLIAHSLACLLIAHWSTRSALPILGAFLVSVPDPASSRFPKVEAVGFANVPNQRLRFPSMIVASSDDPYGSLAYQRDRATTWGSSFADVGECGHINASSGVGTWTAGRKILDEFAETL